MFVSTLARQTSQERLFMAPSTTLTRGREEQLDDKGKKFHALDA